MMASASINVPTDDRDTSRDVQAREAGHLIYNSISSSSSTSRLLESSSVAGSSSGWMVPEDQRACCGIMSPVRRTFCLITLFDLILTFILWVIYTQVLGHSYDAFTDQVVNFTFRTSLFDTVLCAAWRFVPLLLAYGLFRINSPWAVALTTLGTCVFLLCKVFLFNFTKDNNNIMCYLLLIVSFIIAWVETWFLDFKVLPREQKARERGAAAQWHPKWAHTMVFIITIAIFVLPQARLLCVPSERTPLIDGSVSRVNFPTGDEYYSPVESREGSDDEGGYHGNFSSIPGSRSRSRGASRSSGSLALSLGAQEQEYIKKSREVWEHVWSMYQTTDGWKLETEGKQCKPEQGCVHSRIFPKIGKVFRLQGYVNCSPKALFHELIIRIADSPKWSPTVLECKTLTILDDSTTIMYNIAAESAGGFVSSRDFVNLVHWRTREGIILSSAVSVTHPDMPETKNHVRGENGPGGYFFRQIPNHPNRCHFISLLNTDLKGWIPQAVVDKALSGVLLNYMRDVRKRINFLQQRAGKV